MKFSHFIEHMKAGRVEKILIYKNPDDLTQWFPMIKTDDLCLHVLVDEQEKAITNACVENLLTVLKNAGAKSVELML